MSKLDILVNNAGVASTSNVETETLEKWRWLQSINLDAVFVGTQAAIGAMKESGGGSIINVASIEGIIGDPNLAAYNASKGGVRLFTKSAALHCSKAGYGIRVNSVHPGYIWTPIWSKPLPEKVVTRTPDVSARTPGRHMLLPRSCIRHPLHPAPLSRSCSRRGSCSGYAVLRGEKAPDDALARELGAMGLL